MPKHLVSAFVLLLLLPLNTRAQIDTTELYNLVKVENVNTRFHEVAPIVSPDGGTLYWFVENHPDNSFHGKESHNQDIWYATKVDNGDWSAPVHMGAPLNQSQFNQVLAVLNEGNTLLIKGGTSKHAKGLALTSRQGEKWSRPVEIDIKDYKKMNVGTFSGGTLSSDGRVLILYFSEKSGAKFSDLYVSFRESDTKYSRPQKLGLSTFKDEFGPFLAADDKTLYYASNRYGGMGDMDIWVTTRQDESWLKWSEPVNLGAPVNTDGFDAYFSVAADGELAYTTRAFMSADGGSLDILGLKAKPRIALSGTVKDSESGKPVPGLVNMQLAEGEYVVLETDAQGRYNTTLREAGLWRFLVDEEGYEPKQDSLNLGSIDKDTSLTKDILLDPIPAEIILFGYVTDSVSELPLETTIQIASEQGRLLEARTDESGYYNVRLPAEGDYVLKVEMEEYYPATVRTPVRGVVDYFLEVGQDIAVRPIPIPIVLNGVAFNTKTDENMEVDVRVESALLDFEKTIPTAAGTGFYELELPAAGLYYVYAGAEGFLNFSDSIEVLQPYTRDETNLKDVPLVPIEIGVTVRLNKIYFDFDKTDLRPESFPELDRLVELMNLNPSVTIEIGGHTDDKGSDTYNETLSQGRAGAVMQYLLDQGIGNERVAAVGYGERQPEVPNDSDANRQVNRRVEFTVLSK